MRVKRSQLRALIREMFEEEVEDTRSLLEVLPPASHLLIYGEDQAFIDSHLESLAWDVAYGNVMMPDRDVERLAQLSVSFSNTLDSAYSQLAADETGLSADENY